MKTKYSLWKRVLRSALLVLLLSVVGTAKMFAYDFSAVCETGQTLYYNIIDATNHYVELTYPGTSDYWTGYTQPRGDIILPESVNYNGSDYTVTVIGIKAFYCCSGLTGSLTIPNSVTTIGYDAFRSCEGFTGSLTIPNSVTTIGGSAFCGCSGFTGSLTIPNSVTTIGHQAFNSCTGFTGSLTIPNSVTTIGANAFECCYGFTGSLTIGNSVTTIDEAAFHYCTGFTGSLTIPNSVTTIGNYAFDNCSGFTGSLNIGNSVTTIGHHAFNSCTGFTGSLTIGNSVTSICNDAFCGCSGFTGSLTIPNSVTTIETYAFASCSGFTGSLTIPNSVTTIAYGAFWGCSGLTGIYSRNTIPPTLGYYVFNSVNQSIPVYVPCGRQAYYRRASGWSDFSNYQGYLAEIVVQPNSERLGVVSITQYGDCDNGESTVHAEPYPGCIFSNWTVNGAVVSTEADYTFNLTEDITLVANFEVGPNHCVFTGETSSLWSDAANWLPNSLPTATCMVSLWGNVEVDAEAIVTDAYLYGNPGITIKPEGKLTLSGTIHPADTYTLTIEDGGQLVHAADGITATVQKTVTPYTYGAKDGWHLIANPLVDAVDVVAVQNLTSNEYDLYYYDEPTQYWKNQEQAENNFTQLEVGKGYLYGNSCTVVLSHEYGFDGVNMQGWTNIDADGDGYEWFAASGTAHNGVGYIGSESWKDPGPGTLFPDNYAVSPQVQFGSAASISFWACAMDASFPAEHFGVAVSTTGNTDAADFTTIQEWTLSAKSGRSIGTWYEFTVDLSQYAGQMGYVAIRHFNCSEQGALLIDDITLSGMMESEDEMTLSFTGELQNGAATISVPLSYTVAAGSLKGFNLVGNPFVHNVTSYASEHVANGCYVMNAAKDDLIVSEISDAHPLKPAESFFVKATAEDASVTFNPGRGTKANPSGSLSVELVHDGKLIDRLIVKKDCDPLEKLSLNENRTKVYAVKANQEMAVVPCEGNEQAVNFKAAENGSYTISVKADEMEFDYLHLIDNLTGADVDLQVEQDYTFEAKTSDYASRFRLVFAANDASTGSGTFAFISNGNIIITGAEADATLQVVDMMGRIIVSRRGDVSGNVSTMGMTPGVYVLRLVSGNDVKTQTIVVE